MEIIITEIIKLRDIYVELWKKFLPDVEFVCFSGDIVRTSERCVAVERSVATGDADVTATGDNVTRLIRREHFARPTVVYHATHTQYVVTLLVHVEYSVRCVFVNVRIRTFEDNDLWPIFGMLVHLDRIQVKFEGQVRAILLGLGKSAVGKPVTTLWLKSRLELETVNK